MRPNCAWGYVPERSLGNFIKGRCRGRTARFAALQQRWSIGPGKRHFSPPRLIKRSMCDRVSFDLLRLRVMNAA